MSESAASGGGSDRAPGEGASGGSYPDPAPPDLLLHAVREAHAAIYGEIDRILAESDSGTPPAYMPPDYP